MNQSEGLKHVALATLINIGALPKKRARAELRKIANIVDLMSVIHMITDATILRTALGVFINHQHCTIDMLYLLFTDQRYSDNYQKMISDALLRRDGHNQDWFLRFLACAGNGAECYMIDQRSKDPQYQHFLVDIFLSHDVPEYEVELAYAIVCHPLLYENLLTLIRAAVDPNAKLIFAKAAAKIEYLDMDVIRGLFRHIDGDSQREVEFIDVIPVSYGETFFILLMETEFEESRKACIRKARGHIFSNGTVEYWTMQARHLQRDDAVRWLEDFLFDIYAAYTVEELLFRLGDIGDTNQDTRTMITTILSSSREKLFEIAGVKPSS